MYIYLLRSVVHNKLPIRKDCTRVEVLPTGYFFHPLEGGSKTLVSYCVQVNLNALRLMGVSANPTPEFVYSVLANRIEMMIVNIGMVATQPKNLQEDAKVHSGF